MVRFYSAHKRISSLTQINTGNANILADWQRAEITETDSDATDCIYINGVLLQQKETNTTRFTHLEHVKQYLRDEILSKVPSTNDTAKAIDYLMTTMHQGGFLNPVSAALSDAIKKTWEEETMIIADRQRTKKVYIISTKSGFQVQEIATFNGLHYFKKDQKAPQYISNQTPGAKAPPYIIQAHATLDVDLSDFWDASCSNPTAKITVEENAISYGDPYIKDKMDNRSIGQIIIDFFKHMLGLYVFKQIEPVHENEVAGGITPL